MSELHAAGWPLFAIGLALLGLAAAVAAMRGRRPAALEWSRRAALVALVAQASIGLALAARGAAPSELLHWIYGAVVIGVLLVSGSLPAEVADGPRSWALAAGSAIGVVLVWRLWASG
jgi:hypothetical protein